MAITCKRYKKLPDSKRCQYYQANGSCSHPSELMCVEWLKVNGSPSSGSISPTLAERLAAHVPSPPPAPEPAPEKLDPCSPVLLNALTPERVAHLKRERIELLIELDDAGTVLLTPERDDATDPLATHERLTYDDALAIASVAVTFPGARLKRVTRPRKATNRKSEGTR